MLQKQGSKKFVTGAGLLLLVISSIPSHAQEATRPNDGGATSSPDEQSAHKRLKPKNVYKKGTPLPFQGPPKESRSRDADSEKPKAD